MNNYFYIFLDHGLKAEWKNFFIDKKNLVFYKNFVNIIKKVVGKPVGKVLEK